MKEYRRSPGSIASLSPEQYRVTQRLWPSDHFKMNIGTTRSQGSMSMSSLEPLFVFL
jgi:hypothetical protein